MRILAAAFIILASTSLTAYAAPQVLAESESGIVFGDLDCPIQSHTVSEASLYEGDFGYLSADVEVETTCVREDGTTWTDHGGDSVPFLTLTFDRVTQTWNTNGVVVATRVDFRTIEKNPELTYGVWHFSDDTHVDFKVQISKIPAH